MDSLVTGTMASRENCWLAPDLFQALHLQWLEHYSFHSKLLEKHLIDSVKTRFSSLGFSEQAKWYGAYYRREILHPKLSDFYIRWIDSQMGFGVFASRALPKGHGVGAYLGEIRYRSLWRPSDINSYCFSFPIQPSWYHKLLHGCWTIDALRAGNHTRFINHSNNPNCEAVAAYLNSLVYIFIRTQKPIAQNEQLFYNYGNAYWKRRTDGIEQPNTFEK